jgi:hypothetical protein
MPWEVQVTGPVGILDELTRAFRTGDPTLTHEDDRFVLRSPTFRDAEAATAIRSRAETIVEVLSAVARITLQSTERLEVASLTQVRPDGGRDIFIELKPAVIRVTAGQISVAVTHSDGTVQEFRPSDPTPGIVSRALKDPAAVRALRLRDASDLAWTDLYRLYEIIKDAIGGDDRIAAAGWANNAQLDRFRRTANSVAAAGDQARHGVEQTQPPPSPMPLNEARALIDHLLRSWLG